VGWYERQRTFFSLFFSAVSSLPALAACLLSCLAVNWAEGRSNVSWLEQASVTLVSEEQTCIPSN
jgi:SNF family Na+-dependent transporter